MKKVFCTFSVLLLCIAVFTASSYAAAPDLYITQLAMCPIKPEVGIEKAKIVLKEMGITDIIVSNGAVIGAYPDFTIGIIPIKTIEGYCNLVFLVTGAGLGQCKKINEEVRAKWNAVLTK